MEARFHSVIVKNALEMGVQLVSVFRAIQLKGAEEEEEEWRPNGVCTAVVDYQLGTKYHAEGHWMSSALKDSLFVCLVFICLFESTSPPLSCPRSPGLRYHCQSAKLLSSLSFNPNTFCLYCLPALLLEAGREGTDFIFALL